MLWAKQEKKVMAGMVSMTSNLVLVVMKLAAGIATGSVGIISEAVHSSVDLVAALIATMSLKLLPNPRTDITLTGMEKSKTFSGVIEGILIFSAAVFIIAEAVRRIRAPAAFVVAIIAIGIMALSAVVNVAVSRFLYRVALEEDSIALEADALHLRTDVFASVGVAIGLIAIRLTGLAVLDPIIAIVVAATKN